MRQEVESGHQKHGVDAKPPVVLEHLSDFVEENARLRPARVIGVGFLLLPSTEENFALGEKKSQYGSRK